MKSKIITVAFLGFLGIALGAFGAHGLRSQLDNVTMHAYETAVQYHFYHVIAMLAIIALNDKLNTRYSHLAFRLFLIGLICFSGSLYAISFAKVSGLSLKWLGPITPVGGVIFMVAWIMTGVAAWKKEQ